MGGVVGVVEKAEGRPSEGGMEDVSGDDSM